MLKSMISSIVTKNMAKKLKNMTIEEDDIKDVLREIRIALLDADVNLLVVKSFINNIKASAIGQTIDPKLSPSDFLLSIIKDELINVLGKNHSKINFEKKELRIMMVGLQGSGKTTTCAKIAEYARKNFQKKPMLIACDIYRPAAIEQLKTLAQENHFDFYDKGTQDPRKTAKEAINIAENNHDNLLILDTAGRLQTNEELMNELVDIKKVFNPDEILLVVDAMSGQDMINVAKEFDRVLKLTGIVITKLDSDARAGAALSLTSILNVPIKLTGTGEKVGSLDLFYPERMADRILGLGDIVTLAEKAADVIDENKAKGQLERMLSGRMDLEDLYNQMQQMNKMGGITSISNMLPGMQDKISPEKEHEIEARLKVTRALLNSMTLKERRNPRLLKKDANRRVRIVKGSGRKPDELNKLLKQWEEGNKKMFDLGTKIKSGINPFAGNKSPFSK